MQPQSAHYDSLFGRDIKDSILPTYTCFHIQMVAHRADM